jgi:hypothetical protein
MASPRIVEIAGEAPGVLRGKESIGANWEKALRIIPDLRFEKLAVFVGARSLAIHYRTGQDAWRWRPSRLARLGEWSEQPPTMPEGDLRARVPRLREEPGEPNRDFPRPVPRQPARDAGLASSSSDVRSKT